MHDEARPYDGKTHSGTVTNVNEGRIEQYIGHGHYMTYSEAQLNGQVPQPGGKLEVTSQGRVTVTPALEAPHAGHGR